MKVPGSTHHGRPMKIVNLGRTELPMEVIEEYLESLKELYTPESYDLFLHNCNNFSQDLAVFLVGKSIPDEIRNLPETFLRTPIGQMLRGQLDQSMRQMTQAPDAVSGQDIPRKPAQTPLRNGSSQQPTVARKPEHSQHLPAAFLNAQPRETTPGHVHYPQNISELDKLLRGAESTCAAIFFTSATCPPCKIVYPAYDEMAVEYGDRATLIKVDVSKVYDIGSRYQVRATPTFITFLRGQKDQEWSGAHEARLRGNIRLLVQMAHPQHRHTQLRLPSLQHKIQKPIMYTKVPPLDKLTNKIGTVAQDGPVSNLVAFIKHREKDGAAQAAIPNLHEYSEWLNNKLAGVPLEAHFAVIDLLRVAAVDTRVSSFLAAEPGLRILRLIVPANEEFTNKPYNFQVVALQLFCNLFGSPVFQEAILDSSSGLRSMVEILASSCLLTERDTTRSLAAALIYNLAAYDHNERLDGKPDRVDLSTMGDLEAALSQAVVSEEQSADALHALLLALGLILYMSPPDSSMWELCVAMDVREALKAKGKVAIFAKEPLIKEIGEELLNKGGV